MDNYENQIKNLEKFLIPPQYVSLVSSGNNTGTIFKYLGRDENNINLETVPNRSWRSTMQNSTKINQYIAIFPLL